MTDRLYRGEKDNGETEEFTATPEQAKPENSGYVKVIDVLTGEEITN